MNGEPCGIYCNEFKKEINPSIIVLKIDNNLEIIWERKFPVDIDITEIFIEDIENNKKLITAIPYDSKENSVFNIVIDSNGEIVWNGIFCENTQDCSLDSPYCVDGLCDSLCSKDLDCNDGKMCNGIETCVDEICIEGKPPCDDNKEGTVDLCIEGGGSDDYSCKHKGKVTPKIEWESYSAS